MHFYKSIGNYKLYNNILKIIKYKFKIHKND